MKTAVLFDADGVVIRSEPFTIHLEKSHGIPQSALSRFFKTRFPECLLGNADLKQELDSLLPDIGWADSHEAFLSFWFESENQPDLNLLAEILELREAGFLVGLATNQEANRVAFMRKQMGFDAAFDHVFASCEIGYKKPDTRFYETISRNLAKIGIERIVFFDDQDSNIAAANAAGWTAFRYSSLADYLDSRKSWKQDCEDSTLSSK